MPKPSHDLHLDFETYGDLDLKKVGVHRYVAHPTFRVMAVAWKYDSRDTQRVHFMCGQPMPPDLLQALRHVDVQTHAWNAAFETAVLERLQIFVANPLSCTMQRALAYGLPGRLETAALALGTSRQKNMAGHRLMLKMCKPGSYIGTAQDYMTLADYCRDDVEAEAAISEVIPPLQPDEAELSRLDAAMNVSGELGTDLHRTLNLKSVAEAAEKIDAARCAALTNGEVTSPGTQTARLLAWLANQGLALPDLTRATVEEALATTTWTNSDAVEVLQIRLRMARASTRKLNRMLDMAGPGGELRGQFQFCGAGRTGRWSGRGVQVQNLPRVPKGFNPDVFADVAQQACIGGPCDVDIVTPAPVLDCVSWSLRSCLKATDDAKLLWGFDFSQIEARVLAWLAGQQDILQVFAAGQDVYVWAAQQFGSSDRQLGKVLVLALGFGMGAVKLRDTAKKAYGVSLTARQAETFKEGWRSANGYIVQFWYNMEYMAKTAILNRGGVYAVAGSGIAFTCTARTLQMRLPSGRVLYYHRPRLDLDTGSIVYWGPEVGGQWVEQRTWGGKLAENATQAAARDIMSEAMLRVWRRVGNVPCMTVHDELVYAFDTGPGIIEDLMLEPPPWAGGLPLAGESKIMKRYGVPHMTIASGP